MINPAKTQVRQERFMNGSQNKLSEAWLICS